MDAMKYEYLEQKYQPLSVLGSVEKQSVWLVQDMDTGQVAVKKYIPSELFGIYECLRAIRHESLVPILHTAQGLRNAVVIMEYTSGHTMEECLETQGVFSKEQAVGYMIQLLQGLRMLHAKGIIHRDLQPRNLLISTDGVLKILDFDIGRMYKEGQGQDTRFLGTAGYAAPEQFGFGQSDMRTDIYAAGVLMNYMLTGKELREQLYADEDVRKMIETCTQVDPDKRYQTADGMLQELEKIRASCGNSRGSRAHEHAPGIVSRLCQALRTTRQSNTVLDVLPGFRTGVLWKKVIAGLYYVSMGIYSVNFVYGCRTDPVAFVLEFAAILLYGWLAALLPLNFLGWMERVPMIRRVGRIPRIVLGVVIWMILFGAGCMLEEYAAGDVLRAAGLIET